MLSPRDLGLRQVHSEYRSRAYRDKLAWSLTTEQFHQLLTSPCTYCGAGPGRVIRPKGYEHAEEYELFVCGGIDRYDNRQGYLATNSVAACTMCNKAKNNMDPGEFRNWIERVYQHYVKKDGSCHI